MSFGHGFRTDNDTLARRAEALSGLSGRADTIVASLRDELTAHGECWGSDAVGEAFADSHVSAATAAFTGIELLPAGIIDVAERLAATATTYGESETESDRAVRHTGRDLV